MPAKNPRVRPARKTEENMILTESGGNVDRAQMVAPDAELRDSVDDHSIRTAAVPERSLTVAEFTQAQKIAMGLVDTAGALTIAARQAALSTGLGAAAFGGSMLLLRSSNAGIAGWFVSVGAFLVAAAIGRLLDRSLRLDR
jgi:hypothetical protein